MDITPLIGQGSSIIQSYAEGKFRVSNQVYEGPVIVRIENVAGWQGLDDIPGLVAACSDCDVVLLGCGKTVSPETFSLRSVLKAQGLPVELMDTGAACRTFNVLMTEGRRVAAALLPL